ncbi:hypothetical protein BST61_g6762 [Cercospora zeina]
MSTNNIELQKENEHLKRVNDALAERSAQKDQTINNLQHRLQAAQLSEQNSRNERVSQIRGYQAHESGLVERVKELEQRNAELKQQKTQLVKAIDKAVKEIEFCPAITLWKGHSANTSPDTQGGSW